MTAHPFSPFFTSSVTSLFCLHQSEAKKIQHGRLFGVLHQSDLRGCVCKLIVKISLKGPALLLSHLDYFRAVNLNDRVMSVQLSGGRFEICDINTGLQVVQQYLFGLIL